MNSARRVALVALRNWRIQGQFADSVISELLRGSVLPKVDRAFSLELFYGALRNLTLLDFWISELRTDGLEAAVRDLARLGIYQLFCLQTPSHAAVHETVELAPKKHRTVVNGILRAAIRNRGQLEHRANKQPLSTRWSHPEFLITRWRQNFGEDATLKLCQWNNQPARVYARINQLKITPSDFGRRYGDTFLLPDHHDFAGTANTFSTAVTTGDCYLQDPSTALAPHLLDPKPGETILDACAAPGGKTSYIADKMGNRGTIVACDRDSRRLETLRENLRRLGISIVQSVRHDWELAGIPESIRSHAPFDRILVDVPCSNTGVMQRRVDVRWRLQPGDFARMQQRQFAIVNALIDLLKPGGILVYSTCSIEPEENEGVAREIAGTTRLEYETQEQLLPFRDHFDGAFASRFKKPVSA